MAERKKKIAVPRKRMYMLMSDECPLWIDKDGIAWHANTNPRSSGVTVCQSREYLKEVIGKANKYEKDHGYRWTEMFGAISIVPVNVLEVS